MPLHNINEIQSDDYRLYDQEFLKETLSSLANAGQRFSSPGDGIAPAYFTLCDVFAKTAAISELTYSYVQCDISTAIQDTQNYRAMYGTVTEYSGASGAVSPNKSYILYYNVTSDDGAVWEKTPIDGSGAYLDSNGAVTSQSGNAALVVDTRDISAVCSNSYTSSVHTIVAGTGTVTYTDVSKQAATLEYTTCFDVYDDVLNNIYLHYAAPNDSDWKHTYSSVYYSTIQQKIRKYKGEPLGVESYDAYNWYYVDTVIKPTVVTYTAQELKESLSTANDSYKGADIISYVFNDYIGIPEEETTPIFYIKNKKGTAEFEFYKATDGQKNLYNQICPALADIMSNLLQEAKKSVSDNNKNNIQKLFIDTLAWNIDDDYCSDYISQDAETPDYIKCSVYFNPNFRLNVYASTSDASVLYSTSEHATAEYCANTDISAAVLKKITNAGDGRTVSCIADWTGINEQSYDADNRKFGVYDRNTLFNIKADYSTDIYYNALLSHGAVRVVGKYVPPYINGDGYWLINGEQTPVRASGIDAGAPSVVMLYWDGETEPVMRTTVMRDELSKYITLDEAQVIIGTYGTNAYTIKTPVINVSSIIDEASVKAEVLKFAKNALIMSVIKAPDDMSGVIKNGYITTFWAYTETDESGNDINKFTVIKDTNGTVLDLSNLASVNGIMRAGIELINEEPDKYVHEQLVFSTETTQLKNTVIENTTATILGCAQNLGSSVMLDTEAADDYGFIPYVDYTETVSTIAPTVNNELTATIGFFDSFANDGTVNKIQRGSVKLSQTNSFTGINVEPSTYLVSAARLYKYTTERGDDGRYKFEQSNDYVPAKFSSDQKNPPLLDMSGVLVNHSNTLNRINILSLGVPDDSTMKSKMYYSYIGTASDSADKSKLIIGTSGFNTDASRHIIDPWYNSRACNKQGAVDINFNTINLNGTVKIAGNDIIWQQTHSENIYYCIIAVDTQTYTNYITSKTEQTEKTDYVTTAPSKQRHTVNIVNYMTNVYNIKNVTADTNDVQLLDYSADGALSKMQYILVAAEGSGDGDSRSYKIQHCTPIMSGNSCVYI